MRNFRINVNGTSYDVAVEEIGAQAVAQSAPASAPQAPVAAPAPKKVVLPENGTKVTAPMPGTIIGVKVTNGATVKKGDVIFALEAMKMENDVVSPADGKITISVSQGDNVDSGDTLAVIA